MVTREKRYTIDQFEAFIALPENVNRRFELLNGEIIERMPTEEHGLIVSNILAFIWNFIRPRKLGRVTVEARHRVPNDDHKARIPDIAYTSAERALPLTTQGPVPQMPDLAVEVKSPDDSYLELRQKAAYYLDNGSKMVWLVFPEKRIIEVYRPDVDVEILTPGDSISGHELLPGFTLAVDDVFVE
jgi:Uma2 family endonuclease